MAGATGWSALTDETLSLGIAGASCTCSADGAVVAADCDVATSGSTGAFPTERWTVARGSAGEVSTSRLGTGGGVFC